MLTASKTGIAGHTYTSLQITYCECVSDSSSWFSRCVRLTASMRKGSSTSSTAMNPPCKTNHKRNARCFYFDPGLETCFAPITFGAWAQKNNSNRDGWRHFEQPKPHGAIICGFLALESSPSVASWNVCSPPSMVTWKEGASWGRRASVACAGTRVQITY